MLLFVVGSHIICNPVVTRLISIFNDGSKGEYTKSGRCKGEAEFLNVKDFAFTLNSNHFLITKAICISIRNLNPSLLFILAFDYSSAISANNISALIVLMYSPAGISNPKKQENYSSLRNEIPYSRKQYSEYFKGITKNNWYLFTNQFTKDSFTQKTNAIYNINLGELVGN